MSEPTFEWSDTQTAIEAEKLQHHLLSQGYNGRERVTVALMFAALSMANMDIDDEDFTGLAETCWKIAKRIKKVGAMETIKEN